jgi:hypothetical protein
MKADSGPLSLVVNPAQSRLMLSFDDHLPEQQLVIAVAVQRMQNDHFKRPALCRAQ